MKGVWPILFGLICLAHLHFVLFAIFYNLHSSFKALHVDLILVLRLIVFGLSVILPVFTGAILTNNLPDKIISGRQKRNFNIICFVSLLLIPFLIGFVFIDYHQTPTLEKIRKMRFVTQKTRLVYGLLSSSAVLIFHLLILFGLYRLRNFINSNARNKQLGFETENI